MAERDGPPRAPHTDQDPLLQGGQVESSTAQDAAPAGALPSVFGRMLRWARSGGLSPAPSAADDLEAGTSGAGVGDAAAVSGRPSGDASRQPDAARAGPQDGAHQTASRSPEEIAPSGDGSGRVPVLGESGHTTCEADTACVANNESGDERSQRRSSSSSPRSQDGGGLFDRLLGNIAGSLSMKRANSAATVSQPTCLICLENLGPDDFEAGEAIQLDCACRGEVALRHRACAEKWSRVKGDRICDICKKEIKNLPELPPRATESEQDSMIDMGIFDDGDNSGHPHGLHGPFMGDVPGSADLVFDLIRVTWVAMIICILFLEMNLAMSLWTGLIVGVAYTLFVRLMYRSQVAALHREYARENPGALDHHAAPAHHAPAMPVLPRIATIV